jgi:hypothetical protein
MMSDKNIKILKAIAKIQRIHLQGEKAYLDLMEALGEL